MLKQYKFITKIREEGKLLNWFEAIGFLCDIIECNNYDFIKDRIWMDMKVHNELVEKEINIRGIRF